MCCVTKNSLRPPLPASETSWLLSGPITLKLSKSSRNILTSSYFLVLHNPHSGRLSSHGCRVILWTLGIYINDGLSKEGAEARRGSLSILAEALTARWMLNYSAAVDYSKIITIEPGKRSGKPCIRGMRITVQDVFEYLAGGMTEDQILEDFPELTREDINACFAFAADRERKLFVAPA